jgi:DNA-binding transcriptional MerR regulator
MEDPTTHEQMHQIGEVAEQVGLSLRTIRHYEELGLAPPSGRSAGGFRLYTSDDIERLRLVKELKPLGFSLEETRSLLESLDALRSGASASEIDHGAVLAGLIDDAEQRAARLRSRLDAAERVVDSLAREVAGFDGDPAAGLR